MFALRTGPELAAMTVSFRLVPPPQIWLEPICHDCFARSEATWCQDNVYEPCPDCGRKPIRYYLDRRQKGLWLQPPKGATP